VMLAMWATAPSLSTVPEAAFGWLGLGLLGATLALLTGLASVVLGRARPRVVEKPTGS
jgi:hypothetical protein